MADLQKRQNDISYILVTLLQCKPSGIVQYPITHLYEKKWGSRYLKQKKSVFLNFRCSDDYARQRS